MSHLEDKISSSDYKVGYSNLTKSERDVVYSLKNDDSKIIKGADKVSAVVVWDREDHLKEAKNQLESWRCGNQEMWKVLLRKSSKLS